MRLGSIEKKLVDDALRDGMLRGMARARLAERKALERLASKGILIEVGGVWFMTDEGKKTLQP